jgi:hypothetical protein
VIGTARTDFDGFFLFDRVAYGKYTLRVSAASASAAKIDVNLGVIVEVSPDRSVVRVGNLQPRPQAHIASTDAKPPATP